jgi:hypothetical protein
VTEVAIRLILGTKAAPAKSVASRVAAVGDQLQRGPALLVEHQHLALEVDRHRLAGHLIVAREPPQVRRVGEPPVGSVLI